jgi:hypothetical protein
MNEGREHGMNTRVWLRSETQDGQGLQGLRHSKEQAMNQLTGEKGVKMTQGMKVVMLAGLSAAMLMAGACAPTRQVTRVDPSTPIDVDQRFNDVDARQIYQGMVRDALARPWVDNFIMANGRKPVVIVGPIENATQDYIDTKLISTDFEREIINSGRVRFVAMKGQRDPVREERIQGQEWSSPQTRKLVRNELGADYMLLGRLMDDRPRTLSGRGGVSYFKANFEMVDLESNEKVWIGSEEIKKVWQDK